MVCILFKGANMVSVQLVGITEKDALYFKITIMPKMGTLFGFVLLLMCVHTTSLDILYFYMLLVDFFSLFPGMLATYSLFETQDCNFAIGLY